MNRLPWSEPGQVCRRVAQGVSLAEQHRSGGCVTLGDCGTSRFEPQSVWCGSANWTEQSRSHLEFGIVSDDPSLVREVTDFVAEVIAFSEPVGTTCAGPEPNLVQVEYDDATMAAAARELDLARLDWEEEDAARDMYDTYLAHLEEEGEDEDADEH